MFSLDLLGVLAFAVSGNLLAARKNIDIMGSLVLGLCAGLGGGIMRDVILGRLPNSLQEPIYLIPPVVTALTVYLLGQRALHARVPIVAFDALGLGVFATTGTTIAMDAGLPFASALLLGVLTAVGGGMIRDVLANEIPAVFNGSDLYIIPAIVGAGLTALLWGIGWFELWVALVIAVLVFASPDARVAPRMAGPVPHARLVVFRCAQRSSPPRSTVRLPAPVRTRPRRVRPASSSRRTAEPDDRDPEHAFRP